MPGAIAGMFCALIIVVLLLLALPEAGAVIGKTHQLSWLLR
jgi:hypothetical protein